MVEVQRQTDKIVQTRQLIYEFELRRLENAEADEQGSSLRQFGQFIIAKILEIVTLHIFRWSNSLHIL